MQTLFSTENSVCEGSVQARSARGVFFDLFDGQATAGQLEGASDFLCDQLNQAARLESDLPPNMSGLHAWMQHSVEAVGHQYHEYLQGRQAGAPRRYFGSKSHALYFLKSVAPTKMVDGAWLYGVLHHWRDPRFGSLIKTYLEELGEGLPSKNHVVLYKKLLASQGCERWDDLSDEHYTQGAIQLSLAYNAEQFLPEVIGFNLGYEQLPLHLLITSYELKELGIDPYYFTLHVTVDNADSGHAKQAVDSIFDAMPRVGDVSAWWRRVQNGYKLNNLGVGTTDVIAAFDLERAMLDIFARKGAIGQYAHSDYRTVEARTVNDWLANPGTMAEFTAAMEREGWFKRHQDPAQSRFWKLLQGEKAKMFGVFNAFEQQVIYDWIAGDAPDKDSFSVADRPRLAPDVKRRLSGSFQTLDTSEGADGDFDAELRALEASLSRSPSREDLMSRLISLMSPALHHSAAGLKATRMFNEIMG